MKRAGSSSGMAGDESKYIGVRKRKWGKWVSEVRLPNSRERIWLGSYDSPEKAARAFDAAQFCLRGRSGRFNFPDNPPDIHGGGNLTPAEIQRAAALYANTEPSSVPQQQQQQEEEGMVVEPSQTAGGEGDEEPSPSPSHSVYLSEGANAQPDNDMTFDGFSSYPYPGLDPLTSMGPYNYGFDEYNYGQQSLNFDYGGAEENFDGSYYEELFLWNFEM